MSAPQAQASGAIHIEFSHLSVRGEVDVSALSMMIREFVPIMIGWPAGVRIWLVAGVTDMRKGIDTLYALVQ